MCGIVGRVNFRSGAPVSASSIACMARLVVHRGPDGQGVHVDGAAGFGHCRLAIIDLSEAGNQPMLTDDEQIWITYNGEIYNFQEVRAELESRGCRFRSRSDTEVLVEGYAAWGIDVVHRLRGMFAIAIHDSRRDRFVLLRDRVGKKPLYYTVQNGVLV